ncbi:hypothetical protein EJ08DRAFT_650117 [Tothia fuscella]|uniref:F-box domain-containing protein n=1 Tax=Tothia fuscella TaxID=1048955 RepID=A0A9P4TXR7_9PEZI|nr:hypothetical protein EJ08DRAFT_650117 [Tothia fuscella]
MTTPKINYSTAHCKKTILTRKKKLTVMPPQFGFFGLPREVRDMVYQDVIEALPAEDMSGHFNRPPTGTMDDRVEWGGTDVIAVKKVPRFKTRTHSLRCHGLLYASKQMHSEYSECLYRSHVTPIFHIGFDNIKLKPINSTKNELEPYWTISTILKSHITQCKVLLHWNQATRSLLQNAVDSFPDHLCDMLTSCPKLETLEIVIEDLSRWHLRGRTADLLPLLYQRVLAVSATSPTMSHICFEIHPRELSLVKKTNGQWDISKTAEVKSHRFKVSPEKAFGLILP